LRIILILVLLLWGAYLWRKHARSLLEKFKAFTDREDEPSSTPAQPSDAANAANTTAPQIQAPQDMVACLHCQVHFPKSESCSGVKGLYCSPSHRQLSEP
jgi:Sec-independent protein translocase protein TatA